MTRAYPNQGIRSEMTFVVKQALAFFAWFEFSLMIGSCNHAGRNKVAWFSIYNACFEHQEPCDARVSQILKILLPRGQVMYMVERSSHAKFQTIWFIPRTAQQLQSLLHKFTS